ncbi:MAG TPA: hypothetical protein DHV15_02710 [Treponema sp.]|uniref:Uncharacterized protein n=1 Tax=Treponema denticola (strain ATCC 35405 / DSM 14222 / CIP 103919 / JCM 8153 / KCTC 15104) TaxID=243275 RepID=Q73J88_TREDE|nr:hypothetical protein TDE_2688 [Treponema denticola ATCC 35405]HCY94410.1 hypothetical protein [Treponema sp.]
MANNLNCIDYKNLFLTYYFFQIFSINIMGRRKIKKSRRKKW